jgi:ribokinase
MPSGLLALTDLVTPNESELAALTGGGEIAGERDLVTRAIRLRSDGARAVLVKWGARGVRLVDEQGVRAWHARPVPVEDTTAAGDMFNGALAAGLAGGLAFESACARAVDAATLSVTRAGAQPSMPTRAELEEWIRARQ